MTSSNEGNHMYTPTLHDRSFSLDAALAIAQDEAERNKINYQFTLIDDKANPFKNIHTVVCQANSHINRLKFTGGGSGDLKQAKIKSLYEALEETLIYQSLVKEQNSLIYFFSVDSCPSSNYLTDLELLPSFLLKNEYKDTMLPWIKLENVGNTNSGIFYPLSLFYPYTDKIKKYNKHFEQSKITEITNGTGIAIGANRNEAILHGIYEWIERDSYSLFLLKTLVKKSEKARFLAKETLPIELQNTIHVIEKNYDDEIIIIDITTNLNIPAFLVSFTQQPVMVQPSGMGASLCKTSALEQALLEAVQAKDRYNQNTIQVREESIKHYQDYPLLVESIKCDVAELKIKNQFVSVSWQNVITHDQDMKEEKRLQYIQNLLNVNNHKIYHCILHESKNGISLVYVLITGLETFYLIREGIFVPLKRRGREELACT